MNGDVGSDVGAGDERGQGEGEGEFAAVTSQLAPDGVPALDACQTAPVRAPWPRAVRAPAAGVLHGDRYLRVLHDKMRRDERAGAREVHVVMIAVRALWFDARI